MPHPCSFQTKERSMTSPVQPCDCHRGQDLGQDHYNRSGQNHCRHIGLLRWSGLLSPSHPSIRALSGRLQLTGRRQKFNKYSLSLGISDWGGAWQLRIRVSRVDLGLRGLPHPHWPPRNPFSWYHIREQCGRQAQSCLVWSWARCEFQANRGKLRVDKHSSDTTY